MGLPRGHAPRHRLPRRLILLVGALAALTACSASSPRIVVDPPVQDLGVVPQEPLDLTYVIRNDGGSPLRIDKVSTSCGCTQASVDRTVIPPGESALLRVTLDPVEDDLYGDLLRMIYIRSNDPERPEVEVEFRVTILKPERSEG